jgi:hypothetical protein
MISMMGRLSNKKRGGQNQQTDGKIPIMIYEAEQNDPRVQELKKRYQAQEINQPELFDELGKLYGREVKRVLFMRLVDREPGWENVPPGPILNIG